MIKVGLLETDQEFEELLPLVRWFSEEAGVMLWQQVGEVAQSFTSKGVIVILGKIEGKVRSYLCGTYLGHGDFMISQIYSKDPSHTPKLIECLENHAKNFGVVRILAFSKYDRRMFEKYGFQLERYVISKNLEKKEEGR